MNREMGRRCNAWRRSLIYWDVRTEDMAAIAQLGECQTEDLKVPGSIPGLGKWARLQSFKLHRLRCSGKLQICTKTYASLWTHEIMLDEYKKYCTLGPR